MRLHSYLNVAGNAEEAFDLYRSVFGGEFSSVVQVQGLPDVVNHSPPRE